MIQYLMIFFLWILEIASQSSVLCGVQVRISLFTINNMGIGWRNSEKKLCHKSKIIDSFPIYIGCSQKMMMV